MAEKVLLGSLEAGGTKMVLATGYADGTIVERGRFDTTTPEETVRKCAEWFADRGVAALGVGAFGPTAVDPASPRFGQILTTPKLAWRDFDLLGTLKGAIGDLDRVETIVKLLGFVASAPGFYDQPKVINGASDLLVEVFGDAGRHARSAIPVPQLPMNLAVEIEMIVKLKDE